MTDELMTLPARGVAEQFLLRPNIAFLNHGSRA